MSGLDGIMLQKRNCDCLVEQSTLYFFPHPLELFVLGTSIAGTIHSELVLGQLL